MAISADVQEYLDKKGVSYEAISHHEVFSCIEEAKELGIDADEIAKNLIVRVKDKLSFVVLPGAHKVDSHKLKPIMKSSHARLITEEEMAESFKGYEVGGVPPFGELFGIPIYVDKRLLDRETIIFSGGTHKDSIKMSCKDFIELNKPQIVDVAEET